MTHLTDGRRRGLVGLLVLALLCGGGFLWYRETRPPAQLVTSAGTETPDLSIVVPAGTADEIAAGHPPALVPSPLIVHVGDVISIRNDDDAPVLLGPFAVAAGQTLQQRFTAVGTLEGVCNVHPTGKLEIIVEA